MGLDIYLYKHENKDAENDGEQIEKDHPSFKDHYFKLGYFRSSYNGSGINNILKNLGLPGLYELFNYQREDEYIWSPDWDASLVRVNNTIEELKTKPNIRCFSVGANEFGQPSPPQDENEALAKYIKDHLQREGTMEDYSNIDGFFSREGMKIYGLMVGEKRNLFGGNKSCTYVVTDAENEWYVQALEIVRDTIQFVLDQPDKQKYFLHWSS